MVWVGAAEGFNDDFPSGTKLPSATVRADGPERRITARPPSPSGVAMAAMVSSSMERMNVLQTVIERFEAFVPLTFHVSRFTFHVSRFTFHVSRFTSET